MTVPIIIHLHSRVVIYYLAESCIRSPSYEFSQLYWRTKFCAVQFESKF